jgi:hypothetical protein
MEKIYTVRAENNYVIFFFTLGTQGKKLHGKSMIDVSGFLTF